MKVVLEKGRQNEQVIDVNHLRIILDDLTEIKLSVNNLDELVVNKVYYGNKSGAMNIEPRASNEINIT